MLIIERQARAVIHLVNLAPAYRAECISYYGNDGITQLMKAVVTGAAGFIGSHLTEALLLTGWDVVGIDSFTDYYDAALKWRNLQRSMSESKFHLVQEDILRSDLTANVRDADVVFHLAGQPGVRSSWGADFKVHIERNVMTTQRLLEALKDSDIRKFVYASSSSVYGDALHYPTRETDLPAPISPYGVSKLCGERLCLAYGSTYGVPVVALRYFTVYGPRQRPDMAFSRFIDSMRARRPMIVYGDGEQRRDFTFVSDAVDATIQAGIGEVAGTVLNVSGGSSVSINQVIEQLGGLLAIEPDIDRQASQPGDARVTGADITLARELLNYQPKVSLREGLARQLNYQ